MLPTNYPMQISSFSISDIPAEQDKLRVKIVLDLHGIVNVTEAISEHVYEIDVPIPPAPKPAPALKPAAAPAPAPTPTAETKEGGAGVEPKEGEAAPMEVDSKAEETEGE